MGTRVAFLAPHVKHYRLAFWNRLYEVLKEDRIELRVLYGQPNSAHRARKDNVTLPATYGRSVTSHWFLDRLVYQSAWTELVQADLVITPNENKLLVNPVLLLLRTLGAKRVAFWGKGNIYQAPFSQLGEWMRYVTANAVDWWFPYTTRSAVNLRRHGVSCGITPIDNAIDTRELQHNISAITEECLLHGRNSIGLSSGPVGIFCGNLSPNKDLDFLVEAGRIVRDSIADFSLLIIGNGPLRQRVELAATRERFVHYLGPRVGQEKALLLRMGNLFLLPGAVGLAILDSFAAGLPFLTTDIPSHGPEISYLVPNVNGLITTHHPRVYADTVISLLRDPERLSQLSEGARESGSKYSIENMVQNFRHGILTCLSARRALGKSGNAAKSFGKGGQS